MSIRPHPSHTGWYVVDHYPNGRKGKREREPFPSYEAASKFQDALSNSSQPKQTHPRMGTVVGEYLDWVKKNQAEQTYKNKEYRLNSFIMPDLGQYRAKDLTQKILDLYGEKLTLAMVRYDIVHIMALIRWMIKRNYAAPLTWKPELPPANSKIKSLPPVAGVLATIAAISNESVRMLCTYQLYTGLRPREVKQLCWENYREEAFLMTATKTKDPQVIPIPPHLQQWFKEHQKASGYVFESRVKKGKPWHNVFNFLAEAEKITGYHLSPHMIRHCSGTFLLEATNDIYQVQKHLRHSRVTTSEIYVRYSATRKQEAVKSIYDYVNPHE